MVKVIAGKDKDKTGKVLHVDTKKNTVLVEGCNMVTKHTKPSQTNQTRRYRSQGKPLWTSPMLCCCVDGKATRVGFEVKDGKKVRVAKATGKGNRLIAERRRKKLARLKELYQNEIIDAMIKKFGYKNIMEVPKLDKIVINMGVGEAKDNAKVLDSAVQRSGNHYRTEGSY